MKRVMTGYALYFNRRYQRVGHLVQNRYGSRLVGDDAGLPVLIRYVHLNPLAAGIVASLDDLADHPWCGHGALMGRLVPRDFHSVPAALSLFDPEPGSAREQLGMWMAMGDGRREPQSLEPARRAREFAAYRDAVCARSGLAPATLLEGSRTKLVTSVREELAVAGLHRFGLESGELAQWLGLPAGSITRIARRVLRRGRGDLPLG
jgi:hypothetical protein